MPALPDLPQTEIAIIEMTNAFRKESKLGEVRPNAALAAAARAFAQYLARTGKFAHEADGREPHQRAEAQGYQYCLISENLALNLDSRGYDSRKLARDVVEGWKGSPGHRRNLLQRGATDIGIAVVRAPDRDPKFVTVQLFGRPQSMMMKFRIENRARAAVQYSFGGEAHSVVPSTTVTHTSCDSEELRFESALPANTRFEPRDGDRFVVRPAASGAVQVAVERK